MKIKPCLLVIALFSSLLSASVPVTKAQQPAQPPQQTLEQFVARARDVLKLNEDQIAALRKILAEREPKIAELRRRAQANPFLPQTQRDAEAEQRAIRDELAAHLSDDQRARLANFNAPLPVPIAPPYVLINIPPRPRAESKDAKPLAFAEAFVPMVAGRNARLNDEQKILHLLNRITFGPRPGDVARVRELGIARFIEEQLNPESLDDAELDKRLAILPTYQMTSAELYQFYPPPNVVEQRAGEKNPPPVFGRQQQIIGELVQQKLVRASSSNRQLQEVMVDFWFNHFNVFAPNGADTWHVTAYERDVIRPRALGKFRDLLTAVAQSPAILFYLDNWLSSAPDAKEPRPPRPQGPRPQPLDAAKPALQADSTAPPSMTPETMPGTKMIDEATLKARVEGQQQSPGGNVKSDSPILKADGQSMTPQNQPRPEQPRPPQPPRRRDINENFARELMELHTLGVDGGYTQKDVQEVARSFTGWTIDRPFQGGGFVFRPWMHDAGSKTVLGTVIPAGGGMSDGLRVIEILARHPSTARFISKKLCQRFVADEPPRQLVERVTQVFLKTDGDIREVLRAIFNSQEFYSTTFFRSKVKSPLELAASATRALDADTNGAPPLHDWIRRMGEPLYQHQAPTGYSEHSAAWMNTGVFLNRLNFVLAFANNQIPGTNYDPARLVSLETAASTDAMMNQLAALIIHTELSAESRRAVMAGLNEQPAQGQSDANQVRRRVAQMIGLLFGTTEFQRK